MESSASHPWYHLDNAAMMYSAIQRGSYSALYRFSAVMTQAVDPQLLQRAIDKTMPRFPGFQVKIRRGFFWYYFERDDAPGPILQRDIRNPCQPVRFQNHDKLIRFFYYEKRISMEVFHALADGGGALVLFKTLLAVYLREMGHEIPNTNGILDITQPPRPEEWEDAYARHAHSKVHLSMREPKAYACTGTPEPFYTLNTTMGFVSVRDLHAAAKRHGASITEYLAAILLQSILIRQRREGRRRELPVSLAVPINLRPYFPSETLRNFILTVRPSINPELGDYTLDEIIAQVHHHMRLHITRQEMQAVITKNVSLQHTLPLQLVPSPVKNLAMDLGYRIAREPSLLHYLYQPGHFPGARGDEALYPPYGGGAGAVLHPPGQLCGHQLWRYDGDHLCRYGEGKRCGTGIFPDLGTGGTACESDLQPKGVCVSVILCQLRSRAGWGCGTMPAVPDSCHQSGLSSGYGNGP